MNTGKDAGTPITDEMLSAYLDGEVSPENRREIDAARETIPSVDARLRQLQRLDATLKEAFAPDKMSVPQDLVAMIENLPGPANSGDQDPSADMPSPGVAPHKPTAEHPSSNNGHRQSEPASTVRRLRPRSGASVFSTRSFVPAALAASLALIVGYGAGQMGEPGPESKTSSVLALIDGAHPYHRLLEQTVSGTPLALGRESAVYGTVYLTYVNADGAYCREFSLANPGTGNSAVDNTGTDGPVAGLQGGIHAVACRTAAGWRVEFLQRVAKTPAPFGTDGEGYAPVSDSSARALDAFLDETMDGDALGTDREQSLITRGWSTP